MTLLVSTGAEAAEAISGALGTGPIRVLVDAAVTELTCIRNLLGALPKDRTSTEVVTGDAELGEVSRLAAHTAAESLVIGIGGGAVIDRAKLTALLAPNPRLGPSLAASRRPGFILLPNSVARSRGLVVVPTTIGTGAERSKTACLRLDNVKKLVYSPALQPDIAYVTDEATSTLPPKLFMEGIAEILLRVGSYYVGHLGERDRGDTLAENLATEVVRLGTVASAGRGDIAPAEVRRDAALLSGSTHEEVFHEGLAPFSDKCWPLANELSLAIGVRKAPAMAAIVPQLWRRIVEGADCWGSLTRLTRWWSMIADAAGSNVRDPSQGLTHLLESWGVDPIPSKDDLGYVDRCSAEISRRTAGVWGRGLPMLSGVDQDELELVFSRVLTRNWL